MNADTELVAILTDHCVSSNSSEEEYGDWSAEFEFSVDKIVLGGSFKKYKQLEGGHERIETGVPHEEGDTVYALVMRYRDGDSFGCASGRGELVWIFKSLLLAKEAEKRVLFACGQHAHDKGQSSLTISFFADNGQIIKINNPAFDYFSGLESLTLMPFTVQRA